ncbi:MAG TPA: glycoside hydrolase family 2 TIM barrel-domain containing protein [Bacteroidota bacterium]|nr:glycoside hydrolase family 2 TIM barrel-domain containing protein [Bacteroidota bacterium]
MPQSDGDHIVIGELRQVYSLDKNWKYLQDDVQSVTELSTSKAPWVDVTLPHTWNATDAVDQVPGYRRSAGWYKREIFIPEQPGGRRFLLSFEGVNLKAKIFVNGQFAGGHVGGYVGFDVDITPFVRAGVLNEILVRADNSYDVDLIPSQKSDFFIYGGITRNVWLKIVPSRYINRMMIRTPKVSVEAASATCEISLLNHAASGGRINVTASIRDNKNKEIGKTETAVKVVKDSTTLMLTLPTTKNPLLWSPSSPTLYTMVVELNESGKIIDRVSDRFGFRWYEFKEHGPFFLNGKRLLLRGTHRHEDYAGYGMAMPDSLQRKDMVMIKGMGANFVRLAHYPQAPEVYRACDELGILVWDELPWCRGGVGGPEWQATTKRLLKEQISQNIDHPSIIIWSLGNESYWVPDLPGGDNSDTLRSFTRQLNIIAHAIDPSRLTSVRKDDAVSGIVDVYSPSIWAGWYTSFYKDYERLITAARDQYPRLLHVEYGGDSHVGRHTESPVTGEGFMPSDGAESKPIKNISLNSDWSENYIVNLFDWHLHISEQLPWLSGNAQWAFKDFGTPLRPEDPIPYINQKGVVDRAGNPKDAYYVFKSYWTTDPQFCYIESHTWTDRSGPENVKREVKVFSNCDEVELFVNDISQGKRVRDIKDFPASGLRWPILFAEGDNSMVAVGYRHGAKTAQDSIMVHYTYKKTGEAAQIDLSYTHISKDTLMIAATAVDMAGRRCLDYNKRVYFSSLGAGRLIVDQGTPVGSDVIEMANGKAQIEFIPDYRRPMVIEARNQDFKGTYLELGKNIFISH